MERQFSQEDEAVGMDVEAQLRVRGLDVDYENANHNLVALRNYIDSIPVNVPLTVDALLKYVESHRSEFIWLTEARREFNRAAASMTPEQQQAFVNALKSRRLIVDGDEGLQNFATVVSFYQNNHWPLDTTHIDKAVGNIAQSGRHQYKPLHWRKVETPKPVREIPNGEEQTWRSRAEGACVTTPSGLLNRTKTAEIQKIIVNGTDGKIDWKATAQAREVAAARR